MSGDSRRRGTTARPAAAMRICGPQAALWMLAAVLISPPDGRGADPEESSAPVREVPMKYFVEYPPAEQFCPPIRMAFEDAATTTRIVRGRRVNQHPNGGYGLPLLQVQGRQLYHTGADVGWFRQGEPVFAVADGVVRISQGPMRARLAAAGIRVPARQPIDYGNIIVIEHRAPDGEHFLSLSAHLGNDRTVRVGDLVTAGQQIGTIGRNSPQVNGGYDPHLHFGIRAGREIEPGQVLLRFTQPGAEMTVRLVEAGEDHSRVTVDPPPANDVRFSLSGVPVTIAREGEEFSLPSFMLYSARSAGLAARLAGYAPTLEGWRDPIAFLQLRGAGRNPAPLYFVSPFKDVEDSGTYILMKPAASWNVDQWLQPSDIDTLDVQDFRGRVVCLFCIQSSCQGSQSHGIPAAAEVAEHFRNHEQVAVVLLQTVVGRDRRNSPARLRQIARSLGPEIPVGHCEGSEPPSLVSDYLVRGTPWTVVIDAEGTVQFSNYTVRPQEIIRRAERLLAE